MADHTDAPIAEVTRLINEAEALVRAERPRAALERAGEALRACEGLPDWLRAAALHARGRAHDALGDLDAATADLAAARDLEPTSPQRWMFMGQLAASRGEWPAARSLYTAAIEVAEAVGERSVIPQAHWELAGVARVVGEVDVARHELAASLAVAEEPRTSKWRLIPSSPLPSLTPLRARTSTRASASPTCGRWRICSPAPATGA